MFLAGQNDPSASGDASWERADWKNSLAEAVRDPRVLLERLGLPEQLILGSGAAVEQFSMLVPESYLSRMQPGNPADPLLLQVLPVSKESLPVPGFSDDPVSDAAARRQPGLLQKYQGRALLITQSACAVHCRYCFRRQYPYFSEPKRWEDWEPALDTIRADDTLREIILSGGDPLVASDLRLRTLIEHLAGIPHVRRLRIHSRLPIVLPNRVTDELLGVLRSTRLRPLLVVHANHARELVGDCADALRKLVDNGIPVLNQAVLLRGVNDSVEALHDLCERCVNLGVMPYYLHQLDRVRGAAHFEVSDETGLELIDQLRTRLPGYAIPRFVREIPDAASKVPVSDGLLHAADGFELSLPRLKT